MRFEQFCDNIYEVGENGVEGILSLFLITKPNFDGKEKQEKHMSW